MAKKKQQKQSRYAAYNYAAHAQNAAEINKRDREYYEALSKEEKRKLLEEKQRSEEAYRQWEKESEDSSSTSGGIWNSTKKLASDVVESFKNTSLSDWKDTYRMWMEGLYTMKKDESLEKIREKSQEQDEIKMIARYKQLNLLKSDLQNQLDHVIDPNSPQAANIMDQIKAVSDEIYQYDSYFLNEGRNSDVVTQQMFDFSKLDQKDIMRLHESFSFHDVKGGPLSDYINKPGQRLLQDVQDTGNTLVGLFNHLGHTVTGAIDHYLFGNGSSYDSYILEKGLGYLDRYDPIVKKAYKGNWYDPKDTVSRIDSSKVGQYNDNGSYAVVIRKSTTR